MKRISFLLVLTVVFCFSQIALASTVTINFSGEGTVIEKNSINLQAWEGISEEVGDQLRINGWVVYDTAMAPWAENLQELSQYWPNNYHMIIGDYEWLGQVWEGTGIIVTNHTDYDMFQVEEEGFLFRTPGTEYPLVYDRNNSVDVCLWMLGDGDILDSTVLPNADNLLGFTSPMNLNMYVINEFSEVLRIQANDLDYHIQSSVPIPGAFWLLGSGLSFLFVKRRKDLS